MANDAVRRIMAEVKEFSTLNNSPSSFFHAQPLESDLFEWHFTVRGPPDTAFALGVYHGRILLPAEYPLKPPEIILLTPNGRFEVGKRICLSVTAHHQETWQPSWGIRTILTALVGFMPSKAEGVGALDYPDDDRRGLARKSHGFRCPRCGARPVEQLPPRKPTEQSAPSSTSSTGAGASSAAETTVNSVSNSPAAPVVPVEDPRAAAIEVSAAMAPQAQSENAEEPQEQTGEEDVAAQPSPASENELSSQSSGNAPAMEAQPQTEPTVPAAPPVSEAPEPEVEPIAELEPAEVDEITPLHTPLTQVSSRSPAQPLAEPTTLSVPVVPSARSTSRPSAPATQERELLYIAYAIVALMVAVIARRVLIIVTE